MPENAHLFQPQIMEDGGETVPAEDSDWDTDIDNALDYCARLPTSLRQPRQPSKVLMFQSTRKCPAGWPRGVRPKVLPKPDHLRNKHKQSE